MCASRLTSASDSASPSAAVPVAPFLQQLCNKVTKPGTPSAKNSANQASVQLPVLAFFLPPPVFSEALQAQPTGPLPSTSGLSKLGLSSQSGDVSDSLPVPSIPLIPEVTLGATSQVEAPQPVSMGATGVHANEQPEKVSSPPTELATLPAASAAATSPDLVASNASSTAPPQHEAAAISFSEDPSADAVTSQVPISFPNVPTAVLKLEPQEEGEFAATMAALTTSVATDSTDVASSTSTDSPPSSGGTASSAASPTPAIWAGQLAKNAVPQNNTPADLLSLAKQAFVAPVKTQPADSGLTAQPPKAAITSDSPAKPTLEPAAGFLNALQTSISATLNLLSSELRQNNTAAAPGAHSSASPVPSNSGVTSNALSASATQSWAGISPANGRANPASSPSSGAVSPTNSAPSVTSDKASSGNGANGNAADQSPHKNSPAAAADAAEAQAALPQTPTAPAPAGGAAGPPAPQNSSLPMPSASANKADASGSATTTNLPQNAASAAQSPATPATGPVQMAQIVSKAAQSEMRIEMNTAAFGGVEVRTTVHANDVGVVIGSERGDLRSLLSTELPGIAQSLQQQNLRLNQVNFHQSFAFSNNLSSGGDSQPRSFASKSAAVGSVAPAETRDGESSDTTDGSPGRPHTGHLSIHV